MIFRVSIYNPDATGKPALVKSGVISDVNSLEEAFKKLGLLFDSDSQGYHKFIGGTEIIIRREQEFSSAQDIIKFIK